MNRAPMKKRKATDSAKETKKRPSLQKERQLNVRDRLLAIGGVIEKSAEDLYLPIDTDIMISTGSTLLDLNISGGRVRGGGLPGGIVVELLGPPGAGKTAFLAELTASLQSRGGDATIGDGEGRLDIEFANLFGAEIDSDMYWQPTTIKEVKDTLTKWEPKNPGVINMYAIDGLATLSSQLDITEEGDKRGQLRAKELHELCRKCCIEIAKRNKLVVFTNQERVTEYGIVTPGGKGVAYLASLRMRIQKMHNVEIIRSFEGKSIKQQIGIESKIKIIKSSIDMHPRECPIFIIGGMIDDVRGNLVYLKDMWKTKGYPCPGKEYARIGDAINYIEGNNLENDLREDVIDTWLEINELFKQRRKPKVRF